MKTRTRFWTMDGVRWWDGWPGWTVPGNGGVPIGQPMPIEAISSVVGGLMALGGWR